MKSHTVGIYYFIQAQTVYWEQHGLKVIWSSHEDLFTDLESLHQTSIEV